MRLQLASDLHLERYPSYQLPHAPGADLLVLAGDIGSCQAGSRLAGAGEAGRRDFGLTRFSPRHGAPWPRVIYLPGNHEYDGLDHAETRDELQALCADLGILWLDRARLEIEGIEFIGCTLWADFDALAARHARPADEPPGLQLSRAQARQEEERGKAFRAANHYLRKNSTRRGDRWLLAEDLRELALSDQAWLRAALARPARGTRVVVTHFAPSLRSADPRYGLTPGTAGFCNALDDLAAGVDLWLHGHLHCPSAYALELTGGRRCEVRANPRGYADKQEQDGFDEGLLIELQSGAPAAEGSVMHLPARTVDG
jgi:predicted phosphodiesterase